MTLKFYDDGEIITTRGVNNENEKLFVERNKDGASNIIKYGIEVEDDDDCNNNNNKSSTTTVLETLIIQNRQIITQLELYNETAVILRVLADRINCEYYKKNVRSQQKQNEDDINNISESLINNYETTTTTTRPNNWCNYFLIKFNSLISIYNQIKWKY
jgi:hypothetical protein